MVSDSAVVLAWLFPAQVSPDFRFVAYLLQNLCGLLNAIAYGSFGMRSVMPSNRTMSIAFQIPEVHMVARIEITSQEPS